MQTGRPWSSLCLPAPRRRGAATCLPRTFGSSAQRFTKLWTIRLPPRATRRALPPMSIACSLSQRTRPTATCCPAARGRLLQCLAAVAAMNRRLRTMRGLQTAGCRELSFRHILIGKRSLPFARSAPRTVHARARAAVRRSLSTRPRAGRRLHLHILMTCWPCSRAMFMLIARDKGRGIFRALPMALTRPSAFRAHRWAPSVRSRNGQHNSILLQWVGWKGRRSS